MAELKQTLPDSATANAAETTRRSGTSFYWAMRLLPEPKRSAMFALYAYCREVDDIADGHDSVDAKREALAQYRGDIAALYAGEQTSLGAVGALAPVVGRYQLKAADFLAIVDGMETDAASSVRMADDAALDLYVDRVACAVGRLSCPVFGLPEDVHADLSRALGQALQFTNILRDLREDAARDRIYLPQDRLAAAGLDGLSAAALVDSPDLRPVCDPLVATARAAFAEADRILAGCGSAAKPARMMREAYGRLFRKVAEAGFAPLPSRRVRLGKPEKLAVMVRHGLLGG